MQTALSVAVGGHFWDRAILLIRSGGAQQWVVFFV